MTKRVYVIDSMDGELGAETSRRLLAPYEGAFETERVRSRERPDWRRILRDLEAGRGAAVIYTGSKACVNDPDPWVRDLLAFTRDLVATDGIPVLGICFGHQAIAKATGGAVESRPPVRRAVAEIEVLEPETPIFAGLGPRFRAVVSHQDHVVSFGEGFRATARADYTPFHGLRHERRPIFTVQSHPEHCRALMEIDEREYPPARWTSVSDADLEAADGRRILENFAALVRRAAGGAPRPGA
jgi:GMP synthase-like glutamine amidotransferase